MKETNSFTNIYIAHIENARHRLLGVTNALSLNEESNEQLVRAINVINKILQLSEERILTINEVAFLDTIIGITSMNSNLLTIQERIARHLLNYNDLVNEIDPPAEGSWFNNLVNIFSLCTCKESIASIHPVINSGITEVNDGLFLRSAAPDIKEITRIGSKNSYQETYALHQSSSDDKEPSFSGDLKMHHFDDKDDNSACT